MPKKGSAKNTSFARVTPTTTTTTTTTSKTKKKDLVKKIKKLEKQKAKVAKQYERNQSKLEKIEIMKTKEKIKNFKLKESEIKKYNKMDYSDAGMLSRNLLLFINICRFRITFTEVSRI